MLITTGTTNNTNQNLVEKWQAMDYETKIIVGDTLLGEKGQKALGQPTAFSYKLVHGVGQALPGLVHWVMRKSVRKKLLAEILFYKPDVIVTEHRYLTKALTGLLKQENRDIPVIINVTDWVEPDKLWRDPAAALTCVPTKVAYERLSWNGIEPQRLAIVGFPWDMTLPAQKVAKAVPETVQILLINPGSSAADGVTLVSEVAGVPNVSLTVDCAGDETWYQALLQKQTAGELAGVILHQKVTNLPVLLQHSQVVLVPADPSLILAGIRTGNAVVIVGHRPGQSRHNDQYLIQNGYGFTGENLGFIRGQLTNLVGRQELAKTLANTVFVDDRDGVQNLAERVAELIQKHCH